MRSNFVGSPVLRLEDLPLLKGRGRFAADINFPNQLHMRVVRSMRAHGKILSVDISDALNHRGVIAVWTSAEVLDVPPIGLREGRIERYDPYLQPILARDHVRYVGEPVAVVFAEDPYVAEDCRRSCARQNLGCRSHLVVR